MTTFRNEKNIWPFDPNPGIEGVCKNSSILAFMVLCAQFPFIWYVTWLLSEKYMVLHFDHLPGVEGVSVSKKIATMLLHVSLALIWYETWPYSEKKIGLGPTLKSTLGDRTQAFNLKYRLVCFISIAPLPSCKISAKILTSALGITKFKYFTFYPLGGVKVKGVGQICYHVAACVISFNLICIMTHPYVHPGDQTHGFKLKSVWHISLLLLLCLHAQFQQKYWHLP